MLATRVLWSWVLRICPPASGFGESSKQPWGYRYVRSGEPRTTNGEPSHLIGLHAEGR